MLRLTCTLVFLGFLAPSTAAQIASGVLGAVERESEQERVRAVETWRELENPLQAEIATVREALVVLQSAAYTSGDGLNESLLASAASTVANALAVARRARGLNGELLVDAARELEGYLLELVAIQSTDDNVSSLMGASLSDAGFPSDIERIQDGLNTKANDVESKLGGVANPPPPASARLSEDVAFVLGAGVGIIDQPGLDLSFGSSILGYAVSETAGLLFKDTTFLNYFKNNFLVSTSVPIGEKFDLNPSVGLALGRLDALKLQILPALTLQTLDADDSRLPDGLTFEPGAPEDPTGEAITEPSDVSQPVLSIGVIPYSDEAVKRILGNRHPLLTVTFSVGLPYYAEGGAFAGFQKLFSSPSDFEQEGSFTFGVGVAIPLLNVPPPPKISR